MREYFDSILSFIGTESLTDEEFSSNELESVDDLNLVYQYLLTVLQSREIVSTMGARLQSWFNAKGVEVQDPDEARSNIFVGGSIDDCVGEKKSPFFELSYQAYPATAKNQEEQTKYLIRISNSLASSPELDPADVPLIRNISVPSAGTEISYSFPVNTQKILIKSRMLALLKLSFTSGESGSKYISVLPGCSHVEEHIKVSTLVMYFQSSKSGDIIEVLSWS